MMNVWRRGALSLWSTYTHRTSSMVRVCTFDWPPRSGCSGNRWPRGWGMTTCGGQLWLASFRCGWMMVVHINGVWVTHYEDLAAPCCGRGSWDPASWVGIIHVDSWHAHLCTTPCWWSLRQLPLSAQVCRRAAENESRTDFLWHIVKDMRITNFDGKCVNPKTFQLGSYSGFINNIHENATFVS